MKPPAFQLYAADFFMDTAGWTPHQVGVYFRLLLHEWVSGPLPSDISSLARLAGADPRNMQKCWHVVVSKKFVRDDANMYINLRLEKTREEQRKYLESQSEKGKKRAKQMWEGHIAGAINGLQDRLQPEDSSSSSPLYNTTIKVSKDTLSETDVCPHQKIIGLYHEILPELPKVKTWPAPLQAILRARWKEDETRQELEWWKRYFQYVNESDFLMGRTKEAFRADLEWLVRPRNFTKIANGRYHRDKNSAGNAQPGIAAWLERKKHERE